MLVVIAHGEVPERLLAAMGGTLAARATVRAEPMPWGALVLADAPHARSDRWLVAGRPQRDPWGLPLGDLPIDEAVTEYERYGTRAAHLGSGPFVVVDLATGRLLRAPNGIVPAFEGVGTNGLVLGTSRRALELLAREVREIPPSEPADPPGADDVASSSSPERLGSLRWEWLDEEITMRVTRLGPLAPVGLPGGPDAFADADRWLSRTATGDVIFAPPLRRESGRAAALSPTVAARLWSRARLGRQWLFAPVLERPMRDMIALMTGPGSTT